MYFDEVENILESNSTFEFKSGRGINNVKRSEGNIINRMDNEDFQKKEEILRNNSLVGWKSLISKKFKNIIPGKKISSKDVVETRKAFENGNNNDSLVKNMANKFMEKELAEISPISLRNYQERSQRQTTHAMANKYELTNSNFDINGNYYFKPTDGSIKPFGGFKGLDNIMKIKNDIYFIESKQTKVDSDTRAELIKLASACNKLSSKNISIHCVFSIDYPVGLNRIEKEEQKKSWENLFYNEKNGIKHKFPKLDIIVTNKSGVNRMIRQHKVNYIPEKITKSRSVQIKADINKIAGAQIVQ